MVFEDYLKILASKDGSDLYLSTGAPACAKFQGVLKPLEKVGMQPGQIKDIAYELMDAKQREEFEEELEMNLAYSIPSIGRFRVNIFKQRNEISVVVRNIKIDIPRFDDLQLPQILKDVVMQKRGLVLFVGATGSGKSTSLAALIDHRNSTSAGHIITIEDPVEFVHRHKKSVVNQREVGVDTRNFHNALKNTLRQAPDVILIGEVRDRETMEHCLSFAETGHLAISTLHANNANQALDRIINFFPEERRAQLLMDLSSNIQAFVSQRLIPTLDGKRVAAVEILLGTATIKEKILKGELDAIKGIMEQSENLGMQTFDTALFKLYKEGKISLDEAIRNADSANNLRLKIKLSNEDKAPSQSVAGQGLSLESIAEDELEESDEVVANPFMAQRERK
jgi:twitching motility protein PilU